MLSIVQGFCAQAAQNNATGKSDYLPDPVKFQANLLT